MGRRQQRIGVILALLLFHSLQAVTRCRSRSAQHTRPHAAAAFVGTLSWRAEGKKVRRDHSVTMAVVIATAAACLKATTIWYRMASSGEAPARIWPVIMPGNVTMPTTIKPLTVGISAARNACLTGCGEACWAVAPSAQEASMSAVRAAIALARRSAAMAAACIALPMIIPQSGIRYCGLYQGVTRTTSVLI